MQLPGYVQARADFSSQWLSEPVLDSKVPNGNVFQMERYPVRRSSDYDAYGGSIPRVVEQTPGFVPHGFVLENR